MGFEKTITFQHLTKKEGIEPSANPVYGRAIQLSRVKIDPKTAHSGHPGRCETPEPGTPGRLGWTGAHILGPEDCRSRPLLPSGQGQTWATAAADQRGGRDPADIVTRRRGQRMKR